MIKLYTFLLLFGIISAGGYLGYVEYTRMKQTIVLLETQKAQLKDAVAQQEQAFAAMESSYNSMKTELAGINEAYTAIRRQNNLLADKLQEVDLTAAALMNPEKIEKAVNRGTLNAGRCFELLSGAELNEKERNAENGYAFNKECPWFYDDYKSRGLLNEATSGRDQDNNEAN